MSTAPPPRFCKDETAQVLIVEGKDDCHGIHHIAATIGFNPPFGIWEGGSDEGALARFGGLLVSATKRPTVLGIVLDCDPDHTGNSKGPARRWAQLRDRLRGIAYVVPPAPDPRGTIIEGPEGYPRIGIWLMPDNQTEGMFEDYLLSLVPMASLTFAQEVTRTARAQGHGTYKEIHESKAVAHTYLAWQDEPGRPLGIAVRAGVFDLQSPRANDFIEWLRNLFGPSA